MAAEFFYLNKRGEEVPTDRITHRRMAKQCRIRRRLLETRVIFPADRTVFADCIVRTWFLGVRPKISSKLMSPSSNYNWVTKIYPRELHGKSNIFAPNDLVRVYSTSREVARFNHRLICSVLAKIAHSHNLVPEKLRGVTKCSIIKNTPARIASTHVDKDLDLRDPFGEVVF